MIDGQMELEAIKPPGRTLAARGQAAKYPMAPDAQIVTDCKRRRIQNRQAGAAPLEQLKQGRQRCGTPRHQFHQARIAGQMGKFRAQVPTDIVQIKALELTMAQLVKQHDERHQFGQAQGRPAPPFLLALRQQMPFPVRLKLLAKIVNQAKQFD
jgi:hypothetical protein